MQDVCTERTDDTGSHCPGAIDELVAELAVICQERSFDRCLRAGRLVIDALYRGDLDLWRRRTTKIPAFRQLAKHPHLPLSASELYRCVATYEIVVRLEVHDRWPGITVSHIRTVVGLDPCQQEELLARAHEKRWSVSRMARETSGSRTEARENRGRPAMPHFVKILRNLRVLIEEPHGIAIDELMEDLEPMALDEIRQTLHTVQDFCADLERHLDST